MTDPFGDILAAISYGQNLSNKVNGFNRAQGSRLAWEQALLDAGAQFGEPGGRGQPELAVNATDGAVTAPGSVASQPAVALTPTTTESARVETTTAPAATLLQARGQALPATVPPPAAGAASATVRLASSAASALSTMRPATATPPPATAPVEPRAVRLLMGENGFQVVIRDAGLDEAALRKLVGRVQSLVNESGARVNRIIVNGLVAWEDGSPDGDAANEPVEERVLEILL